MKKHDTLPREEILPALALEIEQELAMREKERRAA